MTIMNWDAGLVIQAREKKGDEPSLWMKRETLFGNFMQERRGKGERGWKMEL